MPTWENAWGKLPTSRPDCGSYSSDNRPTSFRKPSSRSKMRCASAWRPKSARQSTSQKVHARNARFAVRKAVHFGVRRITHHEAVAHQARAGRPRWCLARGGSSAGRKPNQGNHQQAGVERLAPVVLHERIALGIVALPANLLVDFVAHAQPAVDWPLLARIVRRPGRPGPSPPRP